MSEPIRLTEDGSPKLLKGEENTSARWGGEPEITALNIQVFDLLGRNVFTHQQDFTNPGKYRFQWNARDNSGNNVASGIYIVAIQHLNNIYKQKITFLK